MNKPSPPKVRSKRCAARNADNKSCGNAAIKGSLYCRCHNQPPCIVAAISSNPAFGPNEQLDACLKAAAFWEHLESCRLATEKKEAVFSIVVKPDLEHFKPGSSCGVAPRLVERLIDLLHERGYSNVAVADGPGSAGSWLENRDVAVLADLVGYRYSTDNGNFYDVLNLGEECVDAGFAPGEALANTKLSIHWLNADFRICFGKNKTHEEEFFALCLHALLNVLPFSDKNYHCHGRLPADEIATELLRRTPVHFALIDAIESNHGADGTRLCNPLQTNAIIGSPSVLLADMVGALKMGLDPYASALSRHALKNLGLPARYRIEGDLTPFAGWKNVPPLLADSVRKRNRTLLIRKAAESWTQQVDRLFPFKHEIDDRINRALAPLSSGLDDHPFKLLAAVFSNYLLAEGGRVLETYRILYGKEKIYRRTTSIGIDSAKFSDSDYESIPDYIGPFEILTASALPDRNGLRWMTMDRSVVIEYRRILPFPFDEFVSKVEIASAVRIMNDNIGGAVLPVKKDGSGAVSWQIERDIYLPQPNWIALFGGDYIDVTKLELIRRDADEHAIFWKTHLSANGSARFDDGLVRFSREGDKNVSITIVARQDFTLPLLLRIVDLDLLPHVKDPLVSDAYLAYFGRTLANYEAAFQGRDVRTGREFDESFGEPGAETSEQFAETLSRKFSAAAPIVDIIKQLLEKGPKSLTEVNGPAGQAASMASSAVSAASGILGDLFDAFRKDLDAFLPPQDSGGAA